MATTQSSYGYTLPTYLLLNNAVVTSNNPFPVTLGTSLNSNKSIGSVNILNAGTFVSQTNPLPVTLNSNAITVTGNVTIPATVTVNSTPQNPVYTQPITPQQSIISGSNIIGYVNILNNYSNINSNNPLAVSLGSAIVNVAPISTSNIIGSVLLTNTSNYIGYVGISNSVTLPVSIQTASNYIGYIGISNSVPLSVNILSLPTASNIIGTVYIQTSNTTTIPVVNVTGSNYIGYIGISNSVTLPVSIQTASNYIGYVGICNSITLPVSILTASNYIGYIGISNSVPLSVNILSLPTASNIIGTVYIQTSNTIPVSIQTNSNLIGSVNILNGGSNINSNNPLAVSLGSAVIATTTINQPSSNIIGYVNILNAGSNINSNNPLAVSLGSATIITTTINQPSSNIIGYFNILNNYSNINSNNPINVSLDSTTVQVISMPGSNIIGGVYLLNNSNGNIISSTNPLQVQVINSSNNAAPVNIQFNGSNITNTNPLIVQQSAMCLDSFQRQRVSEPFTIADYKNIYAIDQNYAFLGSNGGTSNFLKNQAAAILSTSNTSNATAILQSYIYHNYQPGKSTLILNSFNFNGWTSNATKRIGYFDDNDGIYLEQTGSNGALSFNLRSSVSGSPVVNSVTQTAWNIDKMNGTGPSGYTLNMSNVQLFFIDFQWLGVGRVRCGFSLNGIYIDCHEFYCANYQSTVYMTSGSLPIRSEIRNIGPCTGTTLNKCCSTVIGEGGYNDVGIDYSFSSDLATTSGTGANSIPVLCIRMAPTFGGYSNHVYAKLINISILATNNNLNYSIIKLNSASNITGGTWVNVDTNSAVQYNQSATGLTGSITNILSSGFVAAGGTGPNLYNTVATNVVLSAKKNYIANNIQCTDSQAYAVYITGYNNNQTSCYISLQWQEIY